ncbi:hypothetical protein B0H21DRAFT_450611 [Amylocystis lapponica]|nr:hypothetical protein B0H21DRAFT_450611 [Amylocystis lapponica]
MLEAILVTNSNLHTSLGALTLGGLFSTALSGVVMMQAVIYYRLFMKDPTIQKSMVAAVVLLDLLHSCMVWAADWMYLVESFGDDQITDRVFWTAGFSIALTAVSTVIVQCYFAWRLYKLSKGNYYASVILVLLAVCRLASALVTSAELIRLASFSKFYEAFGWVFTLGLCLSTALDVSTTMSLIYYLRKHRSGSGRLDHLLDAVTLYTVENGLLTSIATVASLAFWLAKPHALIYLGLHFTISKLYANSFLASMNARKMWRLQTQTTSESQGHRLPVIFAHNFSQGGRVRRTSAMGPGEVDYGTKVQITIDQTVEVDDDGPELSSRSASNSAKVGV